jgi:hypothetical protein
MIRLVSIYTYTTTSAISSGAALLAYGGRLIHSRSMGKLNRVWGGSSIESSTAFTGGPTGRGKKPHRHFVSDGSMGVTDA